MYIYRIHCVLRTKQLTTRGHRKPTVWEGAANSKGGGGEGQRTAWLLNAGLQPEIKKRRSSEFSLK